MGFSLYFPSIIHIKNSSNEAHQKIHDKYDVETEIAPRVESIKHRQCCDLLNIQTKTCDLKVTDIISKGHWNIWKVRLQLLFSTVFYSKRVRTSVWLWTRTRGEPKKIVKMKIWRHLGLNGCSKSRGVDHLIFATKEPDFRYFEGIFEQ